MKKDEWCKKAHIKLSIVFNKFRQTRYVSQPKFTRAEMFSYIGGYMGMWFGLSLIFDLFEKIYYLILYPIRYVAERMQKRSIKPEPDKNVFLKTVYES
ncbi:uncharacterized protein TNCV_3149991 [Trichonephila clavipes]|nr:uncharacterized protein TNCV_3149991 [Trichonephila clavipes]